ncbi:PREDICTED: NAC domain-containing protein 69-like isoform X2 [Brassica oleracea var. oleracea]|uniref:NAC domain-containing protein 69-like isoform X2 n=1 Tax=Brassica oleracea var. oleracea TaxID=109376 RepID=UPI0006A74606|nr:PREDICTED: NAC domain-containing protein 69-like isoform X2 [Brassica oleracea var. oleracea]
MKNYPVGFRSSPMDEELINFYQKNRILGNSWLLDDSISEINIYSYEPAFLPEEAKEDYTFWVLESYDRKIKDKGTLDLLFPRESSPVRDSPNFIPSNPPPPLGRHSSLPRLTVRSAVTSVREGAWKLEP